jgi:hypothetical protein
METQVAPPSEALDRIVVVEEECHAVEPAEVGEGEAAAALELVVEVVLAAVVMVEALAEVEADTRAMIVVPRTKRGEGIPLALEVLIGRRG